MFSKLLVYSSCIGYIKDLQQLDRWYIVLIFYHLGFHCEYSLITFGFLNYVEHQAKLIICASHLNWRSSLSYFAISPVQLLLNTCILINVIWGFSVFNHLAYTGCPCLTMVIGISDCVAKHHSCKVQCDVTGPTYHRSCRSSSCCC